MSLKYERRLLQHLKHEKYSPVTVEQLAEDLGIPPPPAEDRAEFAAAVADLHARSMLVLADDGRVRLPTMGAEVVGTFKKNVKGFGFIVTTTPYREGDLFVPPDCTLNALTGDKVRAIVHRGEERVGGGGRRFGGGGGNAGDVTGEVVEVITRKRANFTGQLVKRGALWVVMPDGREITQPIWVKDPSIKNAAEGDKVSVEITVYPTANELPEGVIVKVLGEAGLPDVETQAVIESYNLPGEFPKECVEQARRATEAFDRDVEKYWSHQPPTPAPTNLMDLHRATADHHGAGDDHDIDDCDSWDRADLRSTFVITIDPPNAKDYDDAISIRSLPSGGWELGVHIADVAHFIPAKSALDEESRERGNSVYLPRLVIPMLPEVLSNGICSLTEQQIRFTKSAFMRYEANGNRSAETVGNTIIKSAKRLTYLEAQALIDGDLKEAVKHAKTEPKYTDELIRTLREMDRCARAIRERRRRGGMIHLELPVVELVFDDAGHVIDAIPEDDAFTHTLIEMFMVEANEVLARVFEGVGVPLLRRVHPEPTPGDVGDLRTMAKVAGFSIPKNPSREELQKLLDATAGTGAARAVHMAVLRTLTKAEYSPALIGHFALASEAYAHFTSPIRRYPDLTVHRALLGYLRLTDYGRNRPKDDLQRKKLGEKLRDLGPEGGVPDQDELVMIGRQCSTREVNAADAERDLRQFLVLQLLENHLGETFPGIVTGVMAAGVFVQLEKFLAEGLIKATDLPVGQGSGQGRWQIDQRSGALVHQGSGRSYQMGDRVNITITAIDLAMRRMDLVITDPKSRDAGKGKKVVTKGGMEAGGGVGLAAGLGTGLGGLDWDRVKNGVSGAQRRSQKSKSRDRGKSDFRQDRKDKGKG